MAMNGNVLGEEIARLILDPSADASTKAKITKQWQDICGTILNHIKNNAEITVKSNIPVSSIDDVSVQIGQTSSNGSGTIK